VVFFLQTVYAEVSTVYWGSAEAVWVFSLCRWAARLLCSVNVVKHGYSLAMLYHINWNWQPCKLWDYAFVSFDFCFWLCIQ